MKNIWELCYPMTSPGALTLRRSPPKPTRNLVSSGEISKQPREAEETSLHRPGQIRPGVCIRHLGPSSSQGHRDRLERCQRRAARWIKSSYSHTASVSQMLKDLELNTLQERRRSARLVFMYKILHSHVAMPPPSLNIEKNTRPTRGLATKDRLIVHRCNKTDLKESFAPKTILDWNKLPQSVTAAGSVATFKSQLSQLKPIATHTHPGSTLWASRDYIQDKTKVAFHIKRMIISIIPFISHKFLSLVHKTIRPSPPQGRKKKKQKKKQGRAFQR